MASYLQGRHTLACGLWVFPEQPFFIQELAITPIAGRLEEPIVEDILQALVQCAQDPLLGHPHGGVWVKSNALLQGEQKHESGMPKIIRATHLGTGSKESCCSHACALHPTATCSEHRRQELWLAACKGKFTFVFQTQRLGETKQINQGWESRKHLPSEHGA